MGAIIKADHFLNQQTHFRTCFRVDSHKQNLSVVYSVITEVMMSSINVALPAVLFFIVFTEICICVKGHFVLWKEYN